MGMFDSVYVQCPKCEDMVEIQSKAGDRSLSSYTLEDTPLTILADILYETQYCSHGHTFHIDTYSKLTPFVKQGVRFNRQSFTS